MRAMVRSLLAELFPGWVKTEVIEPRRRRAGPRRATAAEDGRREAAQAPFGRRSGHRIGQPPKRGVRGEGRQTRREP